MKKVVFFSFVLGVMCVLPNVSMAQSWNIIYGGDYIPTLPPGVGQQLQAKDVTNPFDWTMWSGGGALVPTGSPNFVWLRDSVASSGQKWDEAEDGTASLDINFPSGGTLVVRLRRPGGAVGVGDIDCFDIRNNGQAFGIRIGENNGISFNDGSSTVIPASSLTNGLDGWHVFRFTWAVESGVLRVITYVDGNTTPIDSHLTSRAETSGNYRCKLGSGSSATGEYYLDWLLLTDDGAYAPGAGPAMPAGGYVENSPGAPVATFTPGPPTATPTATGTPTPCQVGALCNGSFDSGALSPWVAYGGASDAISGPVTFCGINPHSDGFMSLRAASGSATSADYYQQVNNYQATQAMVSCYVAVDCNPSHKEHGLIGIDPLGGTDVNAASIVWSATLDAPGGNSWVQKSVGPVNTTPNSTITVWFRHVHVYPQPLGDTWNITAFDDFALTTPTPAASPTPEPTIDASELQRRYWNPYK